MNCDAKLHQANVGTPMYQQRTWKSHPSVSATVLSEAMQSGREPLGRPGVGGVVLPCVQRVGSLRPGWDVHRDPQSWFFLGI